MKKKGKAWTRHKGGLERVRGELGSWEGIRRLLLYLVPLWKVMVIAFFFTLIWSVANLGYGGLAKMFLDVLSKSGGEGRLDELNKYTFLGVVWMVAKGGVYFCMNYPWTYASQKLAQRLRDDLYAHLQHMSQSYFDNRKTGQLMATISSDVPVAIGILETIQDSIYAPVMIVLGTGLLFYLNWPLALITCILLPPVALVINWATRKTRQYTEQLQGSRADVIDLAEETLAGGRVVRAFGREAYEIRRFQKANDNVFRGMMRSARVRLAMKPSIEMMGALSIMLVLWVGGIQIVKGWGNLTLGTLTWFVLVLQQIANSAQEAGRISIGFAAAGVAADRIFTVLSHKSEITEKPDAIPLKDVTGHVTFEQVEFAYTGGIPVLAEISFEMQPGETVAIVGPTGAGKTTIAALIPRFYDVTNGAIRIDGVDVRDCTLASLRDQIGIVPQDTMLFAGTLRENIAYGRLNASDEELIEAAKLANAWEFIERLPEGLETRVGERGVMLSGGQRQRIAIARAVLRNPRILILDEATSSLDTQSEALVQDALQKVTKHRTTLVIAHRLTTIRNAHKILVLKEGHLVEMGRHDELLAKGGIYSDLYRTQFRWEGDDNGRAPRE